MQSAKQKVCNRKQDRVRGVLPVRVRGTDADGSCFEELAHTLDLTTTGARLGAIHRKLNVRDTLVVLFRQRRLEFTVMWTRVLAGGEYQVGLQMLSKDSDPWNLNVGQSTAPLATKSTAAWGAA
ncbi:MAG: hypothetical protein WCC95_07715 [Candidatus Sulfotelmatobacter sp.]|jgi:hypothetical protein